MSQCRRFRVAFLPVAVLFSASLAASCIVPTGSGALAQPDAQLAQAQKPGPNAAPGYEGPGGTAENFPYVYINTDNGEDVKLVKGNVVPVWPGRSCFGWQLQIGGRDRDIKLTEVLTLSGPAKLWVAGPETKISPDQSTATTIMPAKSEQGLVSRAWCITEGDPAGQYRYDIYIDGQHRGQFTYCAVEMPYDPNLKLEELTCPYKFESVQGVPPATPSVASPRALETAQNGL